MNLGGLLAAGGWPMVPIYLCSIAAVAVFVRSWTVFRAARPADMTWLGPALERLAAGDVAAARQGCAPVPHPAAPAICAALAVLSSRPERAAAEAERAASVELQRFERHLDALSFIAQAAPLLGLFGTVVGMVRLFLDLEHAQRAILDISHLSAGIWTALLTTAAGLVVAVFALAGHSVLAARADALRLAVHDAVARALTALPARLAANEAEAP